jgi:hypothetical protein
MECEANRFSFTFLVRRASGVAIDAARVVARDAFDALAGVAELVDAPDLGSGGENHGGSSPSARTKKNQRRSRCK